MRNYPKTPVARFYRPLILRSCITLSLLLGSFSGLAQRGNPEVHFEGKAIDQMIGEFMKQEGIPGMTLAIVQAPYISRVTGYGLADREKGLLASPKTIWAVGQMSRAYTAVAIMQLLEMGKLALENSVGNFLDDLPADWKSITLGQLTGHLSGLPDYSTHEKFIPSQTYSPGELLDLVREKPLVFKAGTRAAASATDYLLLGQVIEKTSGMRESVSRMARPFRPMPAGVFQGTVD